MGFAASQARLMSLISRNSDLEFEYMVLSNHRMYLGNMVTGFFNLQAKLEPESEAYKVLEARIQQLQQADKLLELHVNRIKSQQQAVDKEMQATRQMINKNIERSFGIMGQ